MILGAFLSTRTSSLEGLLLGRFLVGTGMDVGPFVFSLYVTEVDKVVAGCYTCIYFSLIHIVLRWRVCFWVSAIPSVILVLAMKRCAKNPQCIRKKGRSAEAKTLFEKLLGGLHVKYAMVELSKSGRGDEPDIVKFLKLFYGRHFPPTFLNKVAEIFSKFSAVVEEEEEELRRKN
ncbi:hypothetical protein MKX01_035949 [Papaver californicum]|nr:hypothetical protein MKX01_035949 [Papaver californicum]